jgi:uncharacterized Ntn-hydrolase superfamily protein
MRHWKKLLGLCWPILLLVGTRGPATAAEPPIATFSIVAHDAAMEEWGVAVQSRFLAVGAVVPAARAGVGALASQAWGNTTYLKDGLALLALGVPAEQVVAVLTANDEDRDFRQLGVVDRQGRAAAWTGAACSPWAGHIVGEGFCVQGNILAGEEVVRRMAECFEQSEGALGERLIVALKCGQEAGGDRRGMQSAALLVVRDQGGYSGFDDRFIDLRVDDHPQPIAELERLYRLHEATFQGGALVRAAVQAMGRGEQERGAALFARAEKILARHPDDPGLLNALAWEMSQLDYQLDTALQYARRAVELAPEDANIWDTLGEVEARRGNFTAAVTAEEKAVKLSGGTPEFAEKLARWRKAAGR